MPEPFSSAQLSTVDRSHVYRAYRDWPKLAKQGSEVEPELPQGKFKRVVMLGMGGSAAGGDIVAGWLRSTGIGEMAVCKGYIPFLDMSGSLAIACSASGQTAETIMMMKKAMERGAKLVSVSTGGTVKEAALAAGVSHIEMPQALAPRYALPFTIFATLAITNKVLGLGCEEEAADALSEMTAVSTRIDIDSPLTANPSKGLASRLLSKTPAIYASTVTRGAAVRFKNVLNENAKKHAVVDVIPELFHNEVETWEHEAGFVPVFLRHQLEEVADGRRTDTMAQMLSDLGRDPISFKGSGRTGLAQLVSMVYELDMASYYVAVELGRDPLPTKLLDKLKQAG